MITKYEDFLNEKYDPFEGECGINVGKKNYTFGIGDIVKYVEKNYKSTNIKLEDLYNLSAFKDIDNEEDKRDKNSMLLIDDKWKKETDISDEEWKNYKEEQHNIVMKSNLRYPIIVVTKKNGDIRGILDGNHRVKKAHILGKDTIKAYNVPDKDLEKIDKILNDN